MTKPWKWWFEKGDGDEFFIRVEGKSGSEPLKYNQAPHRVYSAVAGSSIYERDNQFLKIFFKNDENPRAFNPKVFMWNASEVCTQFRPVITDTRKFCEKINQLVGSSTFVVTEAQIHQEDDLSGGSPSTFDWDVSGYDVLEINSADVAGHSTPARVSNRSETRTAVPPSEDVSTPSISGRLAGKSKKRTSETSIEDLPVLFKKKKEVEMAVDLRIMEEVKKAYLGSARIPTAHLKLGVQLRQIWEPFVVELTKMKEFPGHFYQPSCVIIDTVDDVSQFKETNASGYHYNVIGGCHNFSAAKRLGQMYPAQDIFRSRLCSIYSNTLSAEAVLWLANRHNKVGEFRHHMSLKEKIQLCRNIFQTSGMDLGSKGWQNTITAILSPEETKGVIKLLMKLATLEDGTYQLLQEVLSSHSNGQLKGHKLTTQDIINGPDMKPYVLRSLPGLPQNAAQHVLSEVKDGNMGMPEFQRETKLLLKLRTIQKMFMDLMGLKNWDDAMDKYPMASTREVLEHFCKFNLRTTPPALKTFCHQLKMEGTTDATEAFRGDRGALGYPIHCDVLEFDWKTIQEAVPAFTGTPLVILDKPQDWTWTEVKTFANNVTTVNIHHQVDSFWLVVLSSVREMPSVEKAIKDCRHFNEPVAGYYMVRDEAKANEKTLMDCVGGMTIARKGCPKQLSWREGHSRNYIEVGGVDYFLHDGCAVDSSQKPVGLYRELLLSLSNPKDWIMDACSGTGPGCIAALQEDRCVLSLEKESSLIDHMKVRLSFAVGAIQIEAGAIPIEDEDGEMIDRFI